MKMLEKLKDRLDDISDEWEHDFVESLIIEMEEGRDFKEKPLSDKQFKILVRINDKWT